MIAVSMPEDDARVIAQDTSATYSLARSKHTWAALDLVARRASGLELRFPLTFQAAKHLVFFIGCALEEPQYFSGRLTGGLLFLYEARRFQIWRRGQIMMMSPETAESVLEAIREHVA